MASLACSRNFAEAARNEALPSSCFAIIARSASSTAGRSCLNCSTAARKSAISRRSKPKNSLSSCDSLAVSVMSQRSTSSLCWISTAVHVVAEDDVVLRIALAQLLVDFLVQVVALVLGLPVAQRHAQFVQQRAVDGDVRLGGGLERVLGQEHQVLLLAPVLEQVLERFPDDGFAMAAAGLLDDVELAQVVVDQELAHRVVRPSLLFWGSRAARPDELHSREVGCPAPPSRRTVRGRARPAGVIFARPVLLLSLRPIVKRPDLMSHRCFHR